MKRKFAAVIIIASVVGTVFLAGCSGARTSFNWPDEGAVEFRVEYAAELREYKFNTDGSPVVKKDSSGNELKDENGDKTYEYDVVTSPDSALVLSGEKTAEADVGVFFSDLSVKYNDVKKDKDGNGYEGTTDSVFSEVTFYSRGGGRAAYALQPLAVKKSVTYGNRYDGALNYEYSFNYGAGEGTFKNAAGEEKKVERRGLTDVWDNEQLYFMLGLSLKAAKTSETADASSSSFNVFNVYEAATKGAGPENFTVSAGDDIKEVKFGGEVCVSSADGHIARATAGALNGGSFKGAAIEAYYSLKDGKHYRINGAESSLPAYRLLAVRRQIRDARGHIVSEFIIRIRPGA